MCRLPRNDEVHTARYERLGRQRLAVSDGILDRGDGRSWLESLAYHAFGRVEPDDMLESLAEGQREETRAAPEVESSVE